MEIDKPTWYLKEACPCGGEYPAFYKCPSCGYLTVVCDEIGKTFLNPKHLDQGFTDICPKCGRIKTEDFVLAEAEDIINGGFTKDDYK